MRSLAQQAYHFAKADDYLAKAERIFSENKIEERTYREAIRALRSLCDRAIGALEAVSPEFEVEEE